MDRSLRSARRARDPLAPGFPLLASFFGRKYHSNNLKTREFVLKDGKISSDA
jgi:hypothetical protein